MVEFLFVQSGDYAFIFSIFEKYLQCIKEPTTVHCDERTSAYQNKVLRGGLKQAQPVCGK